MDTSEYKPAGNVINSRNNDNVYNLGVGLKSEWEITLKDAKTGEIRQYIPWHKNMILDAGLNYILALNNQSIGKGTYTQPSFSYIAVGSGNSAPSSTNTGLQTQVMRKSYATADSVSYNNSDPAAPYGIIGVTFIESEANGDLKEVGLCTAATGGTFFNRDLFKDGDGNPVTITKTSNDLLTVKCKITFKRVSETPSSYNVTASDNTVYAVKGIITNAGLLAALKNRVWNVCQMRTGTGTTDPSATDTRPLTGEMYSSVNGEWLTAHPGPTGGFYRDYHLLANPSDCNQNIAEVCHGNGWYQAYEDYNDPFNSRFTFSPALAKTSAKKLTLTMRVTLSRL